MKSLNNKSVKRQKEGKRKRDDDDDDDDNEKLRDKHVKLNDELLSKNVDNLELDDDNEAAGFLDEYCQILLKDSAGNDEQDDVILDDELLTEKNHHDIFNEEKSTLMVKLKNWVLKNNLNIKHNVVDELLVILRDEGYLDLPTTTEELLEQDEMSEFSKKNLNFRREFDEHSVWIKKEGDNDDLWAAGDNNISQHQLNDKNQDINPLNCSNLTDDDFIISKPSSDPGNVKSTSSEPLSNLKKSSLYSVIRGELKKMDERWSRQLESTRRNLLYDMVRKYEDLKSRIGGSNRPYGTNFTDDKEILGVKLPFKSIDSFSEFDSTIADNPEKEVAMKSLMTTLCFGASTLSNSIGSILSAFLTKDLQMQYSACGKKIRGIKKRNFGDTNTFTFVKDVLRDKHGTSDAEIISKTSRWFTGAGDRDGGRKERRNDLKNKN